MKDEGSVINSRHLLDDVCALIEKARGQVARVANYEIAMLYWNVGKRINLEILNNERAEYGKQIIETISRQLTTRYGNDFGTRSLRRMIQFSISFPDIEIVSTLSTQLSWSHFIELLPIKDDLQREFYTQMCRYERWSVRVLRDKMYGMLYERTAISGKTEDLIRENLTELRDRDLLSPDLVFKNPYFLEFTGLRGYYNERSLEDVLIMELERFILELGIGFTFVERQKRMIIDGEDFYLDLLFYHRKLHRLIAIELKTGKFRAAYKGQIELYLQWLNKYERQEGEESPLGLILCAEGGSEQIELLQLNSSGIKVAHYYTELPAKDVLEAKLRKSVEIARMRFKDRGES